MDPKVAKAERVEAIKALYPDMLNEDGSIPSRRICVWDIASAKMIKKLEGHSGQLRDIFSSRVSDTVVTSAYDKTVKIWLNEM